MGGEQGRRAGKEEKPTEWVLSSQPPHVSGAYPCGEFLKNENTDTNIKPKGSKEPHSSEISLL